MMVNVFSNLIHIGKCVGAITSANMYNDEFVTIEGKTEDGKKFSITLSIKEEEKKNA